MGKSTLKDLNYKSNDSLSEISSPKSSEEISKLSSIYIFIFSCQCIYILLKTPAHNSFYPF